jgi:PncC family amidohydrolase
MEKPVTVARKLVEALEREKMTCATAESCTGGGVAHAITSVPGSSAVFAGSVVSYANSAKRDVLGVPEKIIVEHGAVSSECAVAMADGVRRLLGTDLAVSLTGIAGPGGGSAEKPVGLVWFAVSSASGTVAEKKIFGGDRDAVRSVAVGHALELLLAACRRKRG